MSEYGYLGCKDCEVMIYLGKWSLDKTRFLDGQLSEPEVGKKALRFISTHLNHNIFAGSDEGGTIKDSYFDIFKVVDKEYENT